MARFTAVLLESLPQLVPDLLMQAYAPCIMLQVPEDIQHQIEQAGAALGTDADCESLRFPLSLSETKTEKDNKGEECTVFDVVYNDEAMKQAVAFRYACHHTYATCLVDMHLCT